MLANTMLAFKFIYTFANTVLAFCSVKCTAKLTNKANKKFKVR